VKKYNNFERRAAQLLSRTPGLKSKLKRFYQKLNYLKYKKDYTFRVNFNIKELTYEDTETFFGYYDKSPANKNGLVLAHLSSNPTIKLPSADKPIKVALFSPDLKTILWSADTFAYNWQQGARLHWLNDELFIYNDFDPVKQIYVSKVVSSNTLKHVKTFDYPVQDSFGTNYFLSLNYRRLISLRPDYGYRNIPAMSYDELKNLDNDGIWKVDYSTGKAILLISLRQICNINLRNNFSSALHKVNHVMISPDGFRFIFLHRYFIRKRRFDRLMLADLETGKIKILAAYGMVSHYFWVDDQKVFGYMRGPNNKDAFWLIDVKAASFTHFSILDNLSDGHPHFHGDWFVVDTYPDKAGMQHLYLVNWKTSEVKHLGEFFHGFEYSGETRCDLHPRFSPCGKKVYLDSVFSGKRKLYELELSL